MVQNMISLRFANSIFEALWDRHHIVNVKITSKEDFGAEGRSGYFDEYGIIRDVMQNHLLQMMSLVAMEAPKSLDSSSIREAKVDVLRYVPILKRSDLIVGQYGRGAFKAAYLEEPGVAKGSRTPTYAASVLFVDNGRWRGVPFLLECGKALDERITEIQIQFRPSSSGLFNDAKDASNTLIIQVQPQQAFYMRFLHKIPGFSEELMKSTISLSFNSSSRIDAYERLMLDVMKGDHSLFVSEDEIAAAWRIFTPVLHQLDEERTLPDIYPFNSKGPDSVEEIKRKYGF